MFAACSSDDVVTGALDDMFDSEGNAYMRVAISVPADRATRAPGYENEGDAYGNYNDGDEYAVNDVTLFIFGQKNSATPEDEFVFIKGYQLPTTPDFAKNDNTPITQTQTSKPFAISKEGIEGYTELWAMIVLNKDGKITYAVDSDTKLLSSINIGGSTSITPGATKFSVFKNAAVNVTKGVKTTFDTNGFLMTNMPYANSGTPSSVTAVNTLYHIDKNKIYPTKAEAESGSFATNVNVERINSKIVVTENIADKTLNTVSYEFGDWFVDNYAKTSYLTRHCERPGATNVYDYLDYTSAKFTPVNAKRFMHTTNAVTSGAYRTDFAFDLDYNTGATTNLSGKAGSYASAAKVAMGNAYYFTENTFDVAHQTEPNTTRVVVPVAFNRVEEPAGSGTYVSKPFYTVNVEPDKAYSKANMEKWVLAHALSLTEVDAWFTENYVGTLNDSNVDKFITVNLSETTGNSNTVTLTLAAPATLPDGVSGYQDGKNQTTANDSKGTAQAKLTTLAGSYTFSYFGDCYAYYPVLIQHFGQDDTHWESATTMESNTVDQIYGYTSNTDEQLQAEENYLGRYGVVRNNWYRIRVTNISKMGSPTIPAINSTNNTDDKIENAYIKYEINIVPWVLRGIQDVAF